MDHKAMIAQIIGLLAMAFNILSYQQKTRNRVIAAIRAIVFLNKEKLKADHPVWLIGFVVSYLISYGLTFTVFGKELTLANLIIEFLPVVGMTATTISFRLSDAKAIRRYGLISSPSWLVYNIANFSIGAICCEVLSLCSILIGMFRLDRTKA